MVTIKFLPIMNCFSVDGSGVSRNLKEVLSDLHVKHM